MKVAYAWRSLRFPSVPAVAFSKLRNGAPAIEPHVFAADLAVPEFPDMQETKRDPPAITRDSKECAGDRSRPAMLHDTEIRTIVAPNRRHLFSANVLHEVFVELLCGHL